MKGIKIGEIVTVQLTHDASNTYRVRGFLDPQDVVLEHPTIPGVCIIRDIDSLNQVQANLKNETEKCLDYAINFKKYLDYDTSIKVDSLNLYHIVNKRFSPKQKKELSMICGLIANIYCQHDLNIAKKIVNENVGLLDDFNKTWYSNLREHFTGKAEFITRRQKESIFNIAGFILAQSFDGD